MSWLSDFLHPGRGAQAGQDILKQGLQDAQGYQQPFMDMGVQQGQTLQDAISNLTNPQDFMKQLLEGYEESPYAQQMQDISMERGQQAASQMGLSGSSPALQAITQQSGNIAQQDRENYLQNLMNMYQQGTGLAGSMYGTGAQVGGQMGQQALQNAQQQAMLEQQRRGAGPAMLGAGVGALGRAGLGWLTGGFGTGDYGRGMFAPSTGGQ